MARNAPTQELTGDLLKVWSYIEKYQLDDCLPSDISAKVKFKDGSRSRREGKACYQSSKYHTGLLQQLVKMGYLEQTGKRFSRKLENLDADIQSLETFQRPESTVNKDKQPLQPQDLENLTEGDLLQQKKLLPNPNPQEMEKRRPLSSNPKIVLAET